MKCKIILLSLYLTYCHALYGQWEKIPDSVSLWIDAQLEIDAGETTKLVGYIQDYPNNVHLKTGTADLYDPVASEEQIALISFDKDGRFEASLSLKYPKYLQLYFDDIATYVYIEPGANLAILLNWNEIYTKASKGYSLLRNVHYKGKNASVNAELVKFHLALNDQEIFLDFADKLAPDAFKKWQITRWDSTLHKFYKEADWANSLPLTKHIVQNEVNSHYASQLLKYANNREKRDDFPDNYYDFLNRINFNDSSLIACPSFLQFINSFENSPPFIIPIPVNVAPKKSVLDFMREELDMEATEAYREFKSLTEIANETDSGKSDSALREIATWLANNPTILQKYRTYNSPIQNRSLKASSLLLHWAAKDSVLTNNFKLEKNLLYNIMKIRALKSHFQLMDRVEGKAFIHSFKQGIDFPWLVSECDRLYEQAYQKGPVDGYPLPETKGGALFKKIIAPYNGKFLLVDFWAIYCPPCISNIQDKQQTRAKFRKNDAELDFLFITSEIGSPQKKYDDFVREQGLFNSIRLSKDDYYLLQDLFNFNGIPRYVLVNRIGNIMNDDFPFYRFEGEMRLLAEQYGLTKITFP
ncbi:TlpA family protein disulfide reductase [Olivibacter sitiensis]|uniref:TlpA family protein disulfide reductase n=1 Tax=Olivibacter sitiensis TaxID=376470 RepID=UPI0004152A07|nr:thioredoxin-like domain-containing protein [Olivibacter sitiensis]